MINTVFFAINVIFAIIIWRYLLRKSILDHYRDKLFDLRDDVRSYYIANHIPLSDETYKNIRDLINSHLRFTEKMSLVEVICFSKAIDDDNELKNYIKNNIDNKFKTSDKKLNSFIKETRDKSSLILFDYMVFSSPLLILMFFIVPVVFFPIIIVKWFLSNTKKELSLIRESMRETFKIFVKFIATKDDLEELSYENENCIA